MTILLSIGLFVLVTFPIAIYLLRDKKLDDRPHQLPERTARVEQEERALD